MPLRNIHLIGIVCLMAVGFLLQVIYGPNISQTISMATTLQANTKRLSCQDLDGQLQAMIAPNSTSKREDVNLFRRQVAMDYTDCYPKLQPALATYFLKNLPQRSHVVLHVPKAGGTSLCNIAERKENYPPKEGRPKRDNCWQGHFSPLWCCVAPEANQPVSCPKLRNTSSYDENFVMNENYLDYPLCTQDRTYSMLVREPVSRSISHMLHYAKFIKQIPQGEHVFWRAALAQHNYMTWALSAGRHSYPLQLKNATSKSSTLATAKAPWLYTPQVEDLPFAKTALAKMDFLMDLTMTKKDENLRECTQHVLRLMGMNNVEMQVSRVSDKGAHDFSTAAHLELYAQMNKLDVELYTYAQQLIQLDCEFFMGLSRVTREHSLGSGVGESKDGIY